MIDIELHLYSNKAIRIDTRSSREAAADDAKRISEALELQALKDPEGEIAKRQRVAFMRHACLDASQGAWIKVSIVPQLSREDETLLPLLD